MKTSFIGTMNMLGLAKRTKARFLLTSTSEVYGDPLVHPQVTNQFPCIACQVMPVTHRSIHEQWPYNPMLANTLEHMRVSKKKTTPDLLRNSSIPIRSYSRLRATLEM